MVPCQLPVPATRSCTVASIGRSNFVGDTVLAGQSYDLSDELAGETVQLGIGGLRFPYQHLERGICVDAVHEHENAAGDVDGLPTARDLRDRPADRFLLARLRMSCKSVPAITGRVGCGLGITER